MWVGLDRPLREGYCITMTTKIRTQANGNKIVARSGNRQRTTTFENWNNPGRNHGIAAGILAYYMGLTWPLNCATIMVEHDEGRATFVLN